MNLLTEKEASDKLKLSLATLRRRRSEGRPPRFVKLGASVRYRTEDLEDWIRSCTVENHSAEGRAA